MVDWEIYRIIMEKRTRTHACSANIVHFSATGR